MAEGSGNFQSLCVPKFDGDYDYWSLVIETLLRSKEYWGAIVDGYEEPRAGMVCSWAAWLFDHMFNYRLVHLSWKGCSLDESCLQHWGFWVMDFDSGGLVRQRDTNKPKNVYHRIWCKPWPRPLEEVDERKAQEKVNKSDYASQQMFLFY
ncbi:hypothetical protein E3N88_26900 [Mikania micrantha]|uniref:DUF4219 domain-containing protein n=1 Tax=Mikania micrantha TaxID=192012 RepID=A0A5N6MV58_9ASTR|nr:hypothetical protein E3N88_26900 [Mikania micrantha]